MTTGVWGGHHRISHGPGRGVGAKGGGHEGGLTRRAGPRVGGRDLLRRPRRRVWSPGPVSGPLDPWGGGIPFKCDGMKSARKKTRSGCGKLNRKSTPSQPRGLCQNGIVLYNCHFAAFGGHRGENASIHTVIHMSAHSYNRTSSHSRTRTHLPQYHTTPAWATPWPLPTGRSEGSCEGDGEVGRREAGGCLSSTFGRVLSGSECSAYEAPHREIPLCRLHAN